MSTNSVLQQRQLSHKGSSCSSRCVPAVICHARRTSLPSRPALLVYSIAPGTAQPPEDQPAVPQGSSTQPEAFAGDSSLPPASDPVMPAPPASRTPGRSPLALLVEQLRQWDASLLVFVAGGALMSGALWQWAQGSSLRRHQPYEFTVVFEQASKVHKGTPVRMKGVQIGQVTGVRVSTDAARVKAEVSDGANIIPRASRIDINQLGLAADAYIDITPPAACDVRGALGPHASGCEQQGLIVCAGGEVAGHQGGSMDYMMKSFLGNMDRDRKPDLPEA